MGRGPLRSVVLRTRGHRAAGVAQSLLGTPCPCRCHRESDSELIAGSHLTLTSAKMDVNMEGKTQQSFS